MKALILILLIFCPDLNGINYTKDITDNTQESIIHDANSEKIDYYLRVQKLIKYNFRTLQKLQEAGQIDHDSFEKFKNDIITIQEKVEQDIQSDDWKDELTSEIKSLFKIVREFDELLYETLDKTLDYQSPEIKNERYLEKIDYLLAASINNKLKDDRLGRTALHYGALLGDLTVIDHAKSILPDPADRDCYFNHLNEDELTAFDLALDNQHYDYAEKLLIEGSKINFKNSWNQTALHHAISMGSIESVTFLLKHENIKPLAKDAFGNTPLHIAAKQDQAEMINLLLSNDSIKQNKDNVNSFGLAPCQIAIENRADGSIQILCDLPQDYNPEELPGYGKKRSRIDQGQIIDNIDLFLKLKKNDPELIPRRGLCNGFAFLAQYYSNLDREDDFFQALEFMSTWDGKEESLHLPLDHTSYQNLEEVFEQWMNDIIWFQQSYLKLETFANFQINLQSKRTTQFNLVKEADEENEIVMLLSPMTFYDLSKEQLEEFITLWTKSFPPQTILEFGGSNHATSATILEDGKISYYDSNSPYRMKIFNSPKELARTIQKTKYQLLGYAHGMEIAFMAYQYGKKEEMPTILNALTTDEIENWVENSANHLTPLHLAIIANDVEYFRHLLQQNSLDPNEANGQGASPFALGVTPLNLAILMWRPDFVEELLKHPRINIYKKSNGGLTPLMASINFQNIEAAVHLLNHGGDLFINGEEGISVAEGINPFHLIEIPVMAMCYMHQPEEMDFIKELCRRVPSILTMKDRKGNTLLIYATALKNEELIKILQDETREY